MLVVAQIAPADSVKGRKLIPNAAWTATGTSHQSEAATERTAVRHVSDHTARATSRPGEPLVQEEQQRPEQHPARHRRVDAAARGREHEREDRGPPPAAGCAEAAVDREQEPRERGVAQQRHGRRLGERRDVGVDDVERPGDASKKGLRPRILHRRARPAASPLPTPPRPAAGRATAAGRPTPAAPPGHPARRTAPSARGSPSTARPGPARGRRTSSTRSRPRRGSGPARRAGRSSCRRSPPPAAAGTRSRTRAASGLRRCAASPLSPGP